MFMIITKANAKAQKQILSTNAQVKSEKREVSSLIFF